MPVVKRENRLRKIWTGAVPDHAVAAKWSPDGKRLAVAAVSGPITIFETATGNALVALSGHGFGTAAIDWHPAGQFLASAGQDGKARLWNASTGQEAAVLAGGAGWVERLAWSNDGKILATAAGKKVRLWDTAGTMLREYANHAATISDLAWRPRSQTLAVSAYGGVTLYDPALPEPIKVLAWKGAPLAMAWSPNGEVLAHGNQDATVHFWYADDAEDLQMSGFSTKVRDLSWEYSSRYLATGGNAAVCIWDCGGDGPAGTKPLLIAEESDKLPITALAWQRRGFLIASGHPSGTVRVWQPANKKSPLVGQDRASVSEVSTLAWSPDDKSLAVASGTGTVSVYKIT